MKTKSILLGIISVALPSLALAQTIISDTFNGTNGTLLTAHAPNVNLTGGGWTFSSANNSIGPNIAIQSDAALVTRFGSAGINITSSGTYVKPIEMTLSATLNGMNSTTGSAVQAGVSLGFFSSLGTGESQNWFNFSGLVLAADGTLKLIRSTTTFTPILIASAAYSGSWVQNAAHTLTYKINTSTGQISNISLDGDSASYAGFSTNIFTNANTTYAGFYLSNDTTPTGKTASVDNFQLVAVPEPAAFGMLCIAGLFTMVRRSRKQA